MLCLPYPGIMVNSGGGTKDGAWDVCGKDLGLGVALYCHKPNDNTTLYNLNTVDGLDMKMILHTPPPHPPQKLNSSIHEPQINIY